MKKLLTLLLLALPFCANAKGYTISATLSGIPDGTLFYLTDPFTRENVDSARIRGGKLELRGSVDSPPELFSLHAQIEEKTILTQLLIGNEKITIRGDRSDFPNNLAISGSKFQAEYQISVDATIAYGREADSLLQVFFAASPAAQKEMAGMMIKVKQLIDTMNMRRESFVRSRPDTYAALLDLEHIKHNLPRDTVDKLYNAFSPEMQQSRYGKPIYLFLHVERLRIGERYYDIQGLDASGKEMTLSELKTDYILLDFTSMGCGVCHQSTPELRTIDSLYRGTLTLVSVSMDKQKSNWQKMIRKDRITWPFLWNGEGTDSVTGVAYGVQGFPHFVLIGPKRTLLDQWGGYNPNKSGLLIERIEKHLGKTQ